MDNVCILRHRGHIKSKMHFPYQHNFRTLKNYAGVRIVEHLKKENESEYRFISLTDVAKDIISKARELNLESKFIFEINGERITARAVTYWLSKY